MSGIIGFYDDLFKGYREGGFIEVRSLSQPDPLTGKRIPETSFFSSTGELLDRLPALCALNGERGYCTYFGVLPRRVAAMVRNVPIKSAAVVWVDIDGKTAGTKKEMLSLLRPYNNCVPLPSYVVDSGNGLHAYWLLDTEVYDLEAIESINRGLAKFTKGDHCHDRSRILRVPGSWNMKSAPKGTGIIEYTGLVYELDRFTKFYTEGLQETAKTNEIILDHTEVYLDDLSRLPPFLFDLIQNGMSSPHADRYKDRSSMDFYVACKLLENEFTPGELAGIFTNPEFAISQKTLERGLGYLEKTIKNAIRMVESRGLTVNA